MQICKILQREKTRIQQSVNEMNLKRISADCRCSFVVFYIVRAQCSFPLLEAGQVVCSNNVLSKFIFSFKFHSVENLVRLGQVRLGQGASEMLGDERTEVRLGFRLGQVRLGQVRLGQVINSKECHFNFKRTLFDQTTPSRQKNDNSDVKQTKMKQTVQKNKRKTEKEEKENDGFDTQWTDIMQRKNP